MLKDFKFALDVTCLILVLHMTWNVWTLADGMKKFEAKYGDKSASMVVRSK